MLVTLQDHKARWREIIAEEVARPVQQPEQFRATVLAFFHELQQRLTATECEAFTKFAAEETEASAQRLAAAKARAKYRAGSLQFCFLPPATD